REAIGKIFSELENTTMDELLDNEEE
ncbi:MAG: hypothetical protein ACI9TV_002302, partial [Sulfurimonas sp.]